MNPHTVCVSTPLAEEPGLTTPATADSWLNAAIADFRMCREFARRFDARLRRSLRGQRVGWESYGHLHAAILLPDTLPPDLLPHGEWNFYYVTGESLFRKSRAERDAMGMVLLAESADDWAELLCQALRDEVFDVRYEVVPDYVNVLGETEQTRSGYTFNLTACAPQAVSSAPLRLSGAGATPNEAAREACRQWLSERLPRECFD